MPTNGVLVFLPGEISKRITVTVNGDGQFEDDETLLLSLTGTDSVIWARAHGVGTIVNDDDRPPAEIVLAVRAEAGGVRFAWSASASAALEATSDLASGQWQAVTNGPIARHDQLELLISPTESKQFFRLRAPAPAPR